MNMRKVCVGSRESALAVKQSMMLVETVKSSHPDYELTLLTMKTTGDIILDRSLDKIGGKGLFVKELDKALIDRRSDLSVHSLKDMPMMTPESLPIVAYSKREDPRDVLVLPKGVKEIDHQLPIGCSSKRRMLQMKALYPEAHFKSIRGNVITRLEKLDRGEYSALVLAAAGLKRLGLKDRISRYFTEEEIVPAAGQGILAVQGRLGEDYDYLTEFNDDTATLQALAERAFVRVLDGGCSSPVAAYATVLPDSIILTGLYYDEATEHYFVEKMTGRREAPEDLGIQLALKMKSDWKKHE